MTRYRGMRVRHLLTAEQARQVETGEAEVRDAGAHIVGLDGALSNGQRLFWVRADAAGAGRSTRSQDSTDDRACCGKED